MRSHYLLTGAGFTHNFGGPLATEMWALILNHVNAAESPALKERLRRNFDFEEVYQEVMDLPDSDVQKLLTAAVEKAYQIVDNIVTSFTFVSGSAHPVNIYNVQKLIGAFSRHGNTTRYVFTLNQDLFLERHHYNDEKPTIPGIPAIQQLFSSNFREPLSPSLCRQLPSAEELEKYKYHHPRKGFYYLKLHGSSNWRDASGGRRMVLGRGKSTRIEREPLLAWYFQLFREALNEAHSRLLIIGYGFGDPHVNQVLAEAVTKAGLEIFILSPESPSSLYERVRAMPRGSEVWAGLAGYFQTTLGAMFPANQEDTAEWLMLQERFFERQLR